AEKGEVIVISTSSGISLIASNHASWSSRWGSSRSRLATGYPLGTGYRSAITEQISVAECGECGQPPGSVRATLRPMRAIVIPEHGGPEVLTWQEMPDP